MKLLGYLVIAICVITGALSTITAYHIDINKLTDEQLKISDTEYVHLNYGAGLVDSGHDDGVEHDPVPLYEQGVELTPAVLTVLRASDVGRVRVKEFSFARWDMWWLFAISVVGLIAGGIMVKSAVRNEIAAADAASAANPTGTPAGALARILEIVKSLENDLPGMQDEHEQMQAIIDRLDEMQKELSMQIVDGRTMLIGKLGMRGFAEFMDAFSKLERTLNRAWSAAADGVGHEALACLDEAFGMTEAVRSKLPS
jgi:hypothetical protein